MKIFYHNDLDGRCAAHVVLLFDPNAVDSKTCQAINYGIQFPFDIINRGEKVYIVDYSIEPEDMIKLRQITNDVVWIDHHKTAIEKYKGFAGQIDGIRSIDMAGCELTWKYFSQNEAPEYVRLIGDRDTWTWAYGDRTKYFTAGLEAWDTKPQASVWHELSQDSNTHTVDELITEGKAIQRYKDITQQEYVKTNGFWVDFHDHKCYAVNGQVYSETFEAVVPDADIWLTFRYVSDYWMVSLYSDKDIDVSEIAKGYEYQGKRGGGHAKASGFTCAYPPFLEIEGEPDKVEVEVTPKTVTLYDRGGSVTEGKGE